ncbi:Neutral ceramidase [Pseudolycoriella hygida]|uniref:Neutral ceramidase n=1 Tax=Pseudolycoriella hygida TaxID=35572 RepID=A0A9Q0MK64_9DIPT|nr:Neutral ceramidase [Pseudolycoriella hygida]
MLVKSKLEMAKFNLIGLSVISFWCFCLSYGAVGANGYQIGVGRADCTGPPNQIIFMGYAHPPQRGNGLHLRQFSRAYIVDDGNRRVVYVAFDGSMVSHAVKRDVVSKLKELYGDTYSMDNILVSASHTHGGPGGYMMYFLYDVSIFGFVRETYQALVDGIFNSIVRAHENLQSGRIFVGETEVKGASRNRSPTSYLLNPEDERNLYDGHTDTTLIQMRFVNAFNKVIGAIHWFATHSVSMNNSNLLISSDNVGYAAILLEQEMNPNYRPGKGPFVASFALSNFGDTSPNTNSPKCEFTGRVCDLLSDPCASQEGLCFASGPGRDQFESTKIIADKMYQGARKILAESIGREVKGDVNFVHQFVDFSTYQVSETIKGCVPALGINFASGTTDGPGVPVSDIDFESLRDALLGPDSPVADLVKEHASPTAEDIACHAPKPILLATGRFPIPFDWQPKIVPTQLLKIGDVVLAAVPAETTTMAGRRLSRRIRDTFRANGSNVQVITSDVSNMYSSYVVTPEEYQAQRYEAAFTIFGPHTLSLYIDQFENLSRALVNGLSLSAGPSPPFLDDRVITTQPEPLFDGTPIGRSFGNVIRQPSQTYSVGDSVDVVFISGNPRNNLQHDSTYFNVERQNSYGEWTVIATDADWETKFEWERTNQLLGHSTVTVTWDIPNIGTIENGLYRIRHFGTSRDILGRFTSYVGTSNTFTVSGGRRQFHSSIPNKFSQKITQ